eukprot:CAMPEP_0170462344 /NCGR_PEP_ID=MMETSP0123-20130129/7884_1 /TAXON_ID=182087 /ORGANISM="Favella ehrenbergii, Strain Fehren 1" /LENGTH=262 /DNA_ID=CAMNT_0010727539 /DNA_START=495 /DNA_END=1286 /DNA_ORIENTATION=+
MNEARLADIEEELEMKSGENNRLRKQVADLEKAMQDLYVSRKGNGSLQIELDSLKWTMEAHRSLEGNDRVWRYERRLDLERRLAVLLKVIGLGGGAGSKKSGKNSVNESMQGGPKKAKDAKNNDWIPTQAVRAILQIKDDFSGQMTETCISQILYELNSIWREIMRKENTAIKKRLNSTNSGLEALDRHQKAYDKGELIQEIHRLKKELGFANKQLYNKRVQSEGAGPNNANNANNFSAELENSMKLVETITMQKRMLEDEN